MSMKNKGQKTYITAQGRQIDMDLLRKRNELTPAVGNAKVNARGDELGPGGKIIRKREEIVNEYYKNTNAVESEASPRRKTQAQPEEATEEEKSKTKSTRKKATKAKTETVEEQAPTAEEAAEWEEDENGDFVRKEK